LAGETEVRENLRQCRFVHHKPHMLPGREPGPPWWEASDYPLELRHGLALKDKKKLKKINGKFSNICSADGNKHKNITVEPLFKKYKKTRS
jgi:hypothetical protein